MPSAYLAINTRNGTPQVKRYNGLSSSLIGNAVTNAIAETYSNNDQPTNRVIQFGGANTFYVLTSTAATTGAVIKSSDAGVSWTTVLTFGQVSGGNLKSGLNIIYNNGVPNLCFLTPNTANTSILAYRSADGTTWTNDATLTFSTTSYLGADTVFRSSLICSVIGSPGGGTLTYTPGALSFASFGTLLTNLNGAFMANYCVFNDNLMALSKTASGGNITLLQFDSGGWQVVATLAAGTGSNPDVSIKCNLFVNGNFLYCFAAQNGTTGTWSAFEVTSTYTSTTISSSVLPLGMLNGTGATNTGRALTWVDGQISPGSDPTKYLIFSPAGSVASPLSLYQWVDASTRMTSIDSGSNASEVLSLNKNVEGSTFWTSGENHIELVNRSANATGTVLSFNLYAGSGGTPTVSVRVWYATGQEEYPTNAATLTNPSSGSITGGGKINSGVVINNGLSSYTVTWDTATDGVTIGTRTLIVLEVLT